jgi:hypothetical protein
MSQRLVAAPCLRCCQPTSANIAGSGPSTLQIIVIVRFCAFAPPGSPLDRYTLSISTAEFGLISRLLSRRGRGVENHHLIYFNLARLAGLQWLLDGCRSKRLNIRQFELGDQALQRIEIG